MKRLVFDNVRFIVLHHSAFEFPKHFKVNQCIKEIADWHSRRGFSDVGYHFVIKGNSYSNARSMKYQGAHCLPFNPYSIGICVAADLTKRIPTESELNSIIAAIHEVQEAIGRKLLVVGHNQLAATLCPGNDLVGLVNKRMHQQRTHSVG